MFTLVGFGKSLEQRNRDARVTVQMEIERLQLAITKAEDLVAEQQQLLKTTNDVPKVKRRLVINQKKLAVLSGELEKREHELGRITQSAAPNDRLKVTELIALNNESNARRAAPEHVAMLMERSERAESAVADSTVLFDDFLVDKNAVLSPSEEDEINDFVSNHTTSTLPPVALSSPLPHYLASTTAPLPVTVTPAPAPFLPPPPPISIDDIQRRLDALSLP